ncbi:unnamed protein product [Discosporangium mesarthrocarpum]
MASYQVPAGKYVVKDGARKWPIQEYKLGTGEEVLHLALTSLHEQNEKATKGWIQRKTSPRFNPRDQEGLSFELFEKVLRSGPLCAWGECFPMPRSRGGQ